MIGVTAKLHRLTVVVHRDDPTARIWAIERTGSNDVGWHAVIVAGEPANCNRIRRTDVTSPIVPTFADHVLARANDDRPAVLFEDTVVTYREWVAQCAARAALFKQMRQDGPPHIGVLLENVPDFTMWLGAAALVGATVVGINPTRRGAELARDITFTSCQIVITEPSQVHLLDGLDLGAANNRVLVVDTPEYAAALSPHRGADAVAADYPPETQFLLLFTSGTSGAPKAVITSHGRLHNVAGSMVGLTSLCETDVTYISMPLFHSNALFTAWAPSVVSGAAVALRRTFSASGFLPDVRRFNATYFNYVGKPLAYVLATPEQPDDADNPLVRGYGNEAAESDLVRFAERFGCRLSDGYGQTETGASIIRVPGMPQGALGVGAPTIRVLNADTGLECPRAEFDDSGKLLNSDEAIGEIVNGTRGTFEGYWNNPEADAERLRDGAYWTGDLAYRDAEGFFYFAGRSADWIRVDGENFSGAPIERILMRYPGVVLAAAYGVPDAEIGDRVMIALQLTDVAVFDPVAFATFLSEQSDLGSKWAPTYVRIVTDFPMTQTNKILKRELVKEQWRVNDELWFRPGKELSYRSFTAADADALSASLHRAGRGHLIGD
jgi:fatty-acyl-CoA synthase